MFERLEKPLEMRHLLKFLSKLVESKLRRALHETEFKNCNIICGCKNLFMRITNVRNDPFSSLNSDSFFCCSSTGTSSPSKQKCSRMELLDVTDRSAGFLGKFKLCTPSRVGHLEKYLFLKRRSET